MAEKRRLLTTSSEQYYSYNDNNGIRAEYGSVDAVYERLPSSSTDETNDFVPPKFFYRKRDFVLITVLGILVVVSVAITLAIGIPKILHKTSGVEVVAPHMTDAHVNIAANSAKNSSTILTADRTWSFIGIHPKAAVTSNCPECSKIAADILKRNGSSVDAAISAKFCLSVCDIHHTGLGGGFLMTVYKRETGEAEVIDARETAPALSNETMFPSMDRSSRGGLSAAVPGLVMGLWTAHQRHGHLNWSSLIEPSIELCEKGIKVGMSLAKALNTLRQTILEEPTLRSLLVSASTGDIFKRGDTIRQPTMASTLRTLAREGGDSLYTGRLASNLVQDIQSLGGIMTLDDLRNYTVRIRKPATVDFSGNDGRRHLRLHSSPAPGSGHLLTFFLNIMEGYNITRNSSAEIITEAQRIVEALKFTYARRTELADPDFVNLTELIANLTSKEYANEIRQLIKDNSTFAPEYYGAVTSGPPDDGTSHVSIIAPNGDAVSVTSTINQQFGALVASASTGIILNDEMDDFSSPNVTNYFDIPPSEINFIVPGKRPLSSMCPTIITDGDGEVVLATGASGGTQITSATALVILRHFWMEQDLGAATVALRMHHQLLPNVLEFETGYKQEVVHGLQKIGHQITVRNFNCAVNSVGRTCPGGPLIAVADARVGAAQYGF